MLMQEPTEDMIKEWKEIYFQYKDKIKPNKKDGMEIVEYLKKYYDIKELQNQELENIVADNIKNNEFNSCKLKGENPIIKIYKINNIGKGKELYDVQDNVFKGITIIVGIELKTSYIFVEGSSYLYDELTTYAGLDEYDIKNYFLVAQYVKNKENFNF